MTTAVDVSVVLPTFNERDNIVLIIRQLRELLSDVVHEFVVVDDDSPDGTADVVRQTFPEDITVKVVVRRENPGLAAAIRVGLEAASGGIIVVMDTDFNHSPEEVPTLFRLAQLTDIAIGSRFVFGGGMADRRRYFLSYIYNMALRLVLGTRIDDNLGGFFAIRREALKQLDFDKIFWGFGDYFMRLLLLSQRARLRHVQMPSFFPDRRAGLSKMGAVRIFYRYSYEVVKLLVLRARGKW